MRFSNENAVITASYPMSVQIDLEITQNHPANQEHKSKLNIKYFFLEP